MTDEEIEARKKEIAERNAKRLEDAEARKEKKTCDLTHLFFDSHVVFELKDPVAGDDMTELTEMSGMIMAYLKRTNRW